MSDEAKPADPPETEEVQWLYLGIRRDAKKKQHVWYDLSGIPNDGKPLAYDEKRALWYDGLTCPGLTGTICKVKCKVGSTSVFLKSAKPVGVWSNRDDVMRWQTENRAREMEHDRTSKTMRACKENLVLKVLEPIRRAYHATSNHKQKTYILAQVIEYIQSYRPPKDVEQED